MSDEVFAQLKRDGRAAEREADRRKADILLRSLVPAQRDVADDPSRRIVVVTPGRAGKTTVFGRLIAATAKRRRAPNILYIAPTQKTARRYLWSPLVDLSQMYELGFDPKHTEGQINLPGGGAIYFGGAETADDIERWRGTPWDLVILDESKSISKRLFRPLVDDVLTPRLNDRAGVLVIGGTPGAVLDGYFHEISSLSARRIRDGVAISRPYRERNDRKWQGVAWEWSLHHWSLAENTGAPHPAGCRCPDRSVPHLWAEALELKRQRGWTDDHPTWRREFLGEWAQDDSSRCYNYAPERNLWDPKPRDAEDFGLPDGHDWYYVIGYDPGFSDAAGIVVWAFAATYPDLLQVWEFEKSDHSIRQQAGVLQRVYDRGGGRCISIKGDPARRHVLAELQNEYGVPVTIAEKRDKRGAVEMMSADLYEGRVKAMRGSRLAEQWGYLTWDDAGQLDIGGPNDVADAGLYGYRDAQHRYSAPAESKPQPGTPAHAKALEDADEQRVVERELAARAMEDDWQERIDDASNRWFGGGGDEW